MPDHSMLMRAGAEKDIPHVRLRAAVDYIEANMEPEKAAEAISLLHAAISPGHAVQRARPVAEVVESVLEDAAEPEEEADPQGAGSDDDGEKVEADEGAQVEEAAPVKVAAPKRAPKASAKKPATRKAPARAKKA